jgi:hypothetical protein
MVVDVKMGQIGGRVVFALVRMKKWLCCLKTGYKMH